MFVSPYEKFPVASERKNTPFFPPKREEFVAVLCHKRCTLYVANDSPPLLWVVWGLMRGTSAACLQALRKGDIRLSECRDAGALVSFILSFGT